MSSMKTLILSLLFILGTIRHSEQQDNIQYSIAKLNAVFAKYIKDDLKPEQNALFSPLNIYAALSLLNLGTNGETRKELSKALGTPTDEAGFSARQYYIGKTLNELQTSNAGEVKIANTVFVQKGLKLKDGYLQASKNYYKSEAQQVDFAKGGSEATDFVNNWVSANTKNRIPKLFKEPLSQAMSLLLVSALFFNATWQQPFNKGETKNEKFNTGLKQVEVPLMSQKKYVSYFKNNDSTVEAIVLPYKNGEFNMLVVLPHQNLSVGAVIDAYRPAFHQRLLHGGANWKNEYVDYKIPFLKYGWSQSINNHVIKAGITKIFGSAELDNLVENASNLQVSDITHAAEIEVDEDGTVATAVTSIGISRTSVERRPEPIKFYVDRPFIISIYHQKTGAILFSGIIQNPSV
ncbi:serine protease inhibitor-like isoform X2 [Planococcus citri]|uniref:serine protease inhibitor-like isoform X2 n=1 Tax=Planococcus citri TaxID=170843 RepID=UPI0031F8B45E